MAPEPGDTVVFTAPWPIRPGSAISLQPGDTGTVLRTTESHCAVEVLGAVVVAPLSRVRRLEGDDWWIEEPPPLR